MCRNATTLTGVTPFSSASPWNWTPAVKSKAPPRRFTIVTVAG